MYEGKIEPKYHQIRISKEGYEILKKNRILYLSMEERTGKSLTSILVCEKLNVENSVLIVTKKRALEDWHQLTELYDAKHNYVLINYESLHKLDKKSKFDVIIIDEAHHALSSYPKPSKTHKELSYWTHKAGALIYLSATPSSQSYSQLFHQFSLSPYSPFKQFKNFYEWHKCYGIAVEKWISGRRIKDYSSTKNDNVWNDVKHLFISYTRKDLLFKHEPNDVIHWIGLDKKSHDMIKELDSTDCIESLNYYAETPMQKLLAMHQIEGGTLKLNDGVGVNLGNTEKIDYIKNHFEDSSNLVIFYQYVQEKTLLESHFKYAQILQSNAFAEGIDLSHIDTVLIYSMDFSTAKYTQRRARQCSIDREKPIDVHYLLSHNGLSKKIYKAVAINRVNFVLSYYKNYDEDKVKDFLETL